MTPMCQILWGTGSKGVAEAKPNDITCLFGLSWIVDWQEDSSSCDKQGLLCRKPDCHLLSSRYKIEEIAFVYTVAMQDFK